MSLLLFSLLFLYYFEKNKKGLIKGEKVKVDARGNGQWQECASVQYKLPTRYFFSLSAATGGLNGFFLFLLFHPKLNKNKNLNKKTKWL